MLNPRFIMENLDAVSTNLKERHVDVAITDFTALHGRRLSLTGKLEELRRKRNENSQKMRRPLSQEERNSLIEKGKTLKLEIASKESDLAGVEEDLRLIALQIPNMSHPKAPYGKSDEENREIKRVGEILNFSFTPKDHLALGETLDILDFRSAAKTSGNKFYFLKGEGVLLELALIRYALDIIRRHGFLPMITPDIATKSIAEGVGFAPRGVESNIYCLEETDLCLIGTSEIPLGGYFADQIIDFEGGAYLFGGLSHCFRREAGAAGQFSKGLYRVHQFTKVEMFIFCAPQESEAYLDLLLKVEEEIFSGLRIPYRVVDVCRGDLGGPAYRKFDIEAWMPGRGERGAWGEVTSASNCTDYQARRLSIRYRPEKEAKPALVHTLNGTAMATSRGLLALLENHQQADGSITIPEALQPYTGFTTINPRL